MMEELLMEIEDLHVWETYLKDPKFNYFETVILDRDIRSSAKLKC